MRSYNHALRATAVAVAGIFFGIALYISLAEQPARLALPAAPMLAQWKISFATGIAIQGTLAIVTGLLGLMSWWLSRDPRWLVGGLASLANWPWTLVIIAPLNAALNATAPDSAGAASAVLVERWGLMHNVRTVLGLCALVMFTWASSRRDGE